MTILQHIKIVEAIGNKPIAYTTTGILFWDDEYISKSMLALHLNPDAESASRTHEFMDRSVDWIVSLLGKHHGKLTDKSPIVCAVCRK